MNQKKWFCILIPLIVIILGILFWIVNVIIGFLRIDWIY